MTEERFTIVYASYAKLPQEAQGALRIATNEKIPVTIVGKEKVQDELDLGGYYVIHGRDLKAFINELQGDS
jgi:hypothetical protein